MASLNGFVKLYRSFLDWEWHDDPATATVFIHLLLMANFTRGEWRGVVLQPGQVVTGRKALAEKTGLTERQVRTALNRLEKSGCVTIETTSRFSKISFTNWENFQVQEPYATSEMTSQRPTDDQPMTSERPQRKKQKRQEAVCIERTHFTPPTLEAVSAYCEERRNNIDPEQFVAFYEASGWMRGKSKIKDWKACVRTWEKNRTTTQRGGEPFAEFEYF